MMNTNFIDGLYYAFSKYTRSEYARKCMSDMQSVLDSVDESAPEMVKLCYVGYTLLSKRIYGDYRRLVCYAMMKFYLESYGYICSADGLPLVIMLEDKRTTTAENFYSSVMTCARKMSELNTFSD